MHLGQEFIVAAFKVRADLQVGLGRGNVRLDLAVRVVDDGQEHVKQHEEHEKHVRDEIDRTDDAAVGFESWKIEITENDTKQCES